MQNIAQIMVMNPYALAGHACIEINSFKGRLSAHAHTYYTHIDIIIIYASVHTTSLSEQHNFNLGIIGHL